MEVWKSFLEDEGYFENKLDKANVKYKKIPNVEVYKHGFNGGTKFDIYDYKMKNGQRVLLCVSLLVSIDDVNEEAILIKIEDNEIYELDEVKALIKDYTSYTGSQNVLEVVYTFSEAAEKWNLSDGSVLRNAVKHGRFNEDEYKQSGKVWLITKRAMERVYGKLA